MDRYIEIDGQKLHYQETGEGKPLLIMHGWGCNVQTVASIAITASRSNKVYNIDMPGFGLSPEPERVWGVEEYTQLIEAFVKTLGIKHPSVLGHSFGGRVGILYSSRNDVDKLILVDAAGIKPRRKLSYYYKVYSFKAGKLLAKTFLPRKRAEEVIALWRDRRSSADYKSASPMMKAILSKVVNEDLKGVMPMIQASTLLIWGENDTATPIEDAKIMNRLIKDSGLVSFPGCGHFSFLDNPIQFRAVLSTFLTSDK